MTKKIPLGRQDAQFLLGDSPETPMHVGGYNVYRLPDGAPDDFVRRLVERLREQPIVSPPWRYRLTQQSALASKLTPAWEVVENENIDYHLSHHALRDRAVNASSATALTPAFAAVGLTSAVGVAS